MTLEEVYKHYITAKKAAEIVNVSRETFHKWVRWGRIPYKQQCLYERQSKGKLKASEEIEPIKQIAYPAFRFWSDKHGMCTVTAITFLKSNIVRIKSMVPDVGYPLVSFETEKLMQSTYIKDAKG